MKIIVSCIPCDGGRSGISVYIRETVAALLAAGHRLTLLVEPAAAADFRTLAPAARLCCAPGWTRRPVLSMLWHLFVLPWILRRAAREGGFAFALLAAANRRALAFYPMPVVAVVHDLAQYHIPGKYSRLRMFYLRRILPFFVGRAPRVLAISRTTREDLIRHWRVAAEKITVIYNGLTLPAFSAPAAAWRRAAFLQTETAGADTGAAGDNSAAGKPALSAAAPESGNYILYISRLEHPGKNHVNLIRAYQLLAPELQARYPLVLAGADWHGAAVIRAAAEKIPLPGRVLCPGFVPAADLRDTYAHAAAYVFPSLYEGFGLSLAEAMHYEVPCACSATSALGEIGQGAALLFDPQKPEEIAAALTRILTDDGERRRLIAAGKKRAAAFAWEKHAAGIIRMAAGIPGIAPLFSLPFACANRRQVLDKIRRMYAAADGQCRTVATVNVDFIVNAVPAFFHRGNPLLYTALQNSDLIIADGMPLVWLSILCGCPLPERVTGADLVLALAREAGEKRRRIFFLGGAPGTGEQAAAILAAKYPGLQIAGFAAPEVLPNGTTAGDEALCAQINAASPDLLLVAFGNPKQELWLHANRQRLRVPAAIGVGGTFNFICGHVKRAPQWVQRCGGEWLYRIYQEPRRLAKRYLFGMIKFAWVAARETARHWTH